MVERACALALTAIGEIGVCVCVAWYMMACVCIYIYIHTIYRQAKRLETQVDISYYLWIPWQSSTLPYVLLAIFLIVTYPPPSISCNIEKRKQAKANMYLYRIYMWIVVRSSVNSQAWRPGFESGQAHYTIASFHIDTRWELEYQETSPE